MVVRRASPKGRWTVEERSWGVRRRLDDWAPSPNNRVTPNETWRSRRRRRTDDRHASAYRGPPLGKVAEPEEVCREERSSVGEERERELDTWENSPARSISTGHVIDSDHWSLKKPRGMAKSKAVRVTERTAPMLVSARRRSCWRRLSSDFIRANLFETSR